jgi:hypothetical protein
MPRSPRLDAAGRFFARLDRFVCECPRCGHLIHAYFDQPAGSVRKDLRQGIPLRGRERTYNPLTSRLTCPACRKTWAAGLLLYPVARRKAARQPADQKPTEAQLLQLRQYAGGFLAAQVIAGNDAVNVAVTADCTCPEGKGGWAPACPVHGWARIREAQAALPETLAETLAEGAKVDPDPED